MSGQRDDETKSTPNERVDRLSADRRKLYEKLHEAAGSGQDRPPPRRPPPPADDPDAAGSSSSAPPPNPWEQWQQWAASQTAGSNPWDHVTRAWQQWAEGFAAGAPPPNPWAAGFPWQSWPGAGGGPPPPAAGPAGGGVEPLVALKKSGSHPPLFLVAPIFGSVFPYHYLALHLEEEQPLYGLQSPAVNGGDPPETIPAAAEHYVRTMKKQQPAGPYYVGGYSFGGWAAFEIARRLLRAGDEVAFLGMLGTCAPPTVAAPLHAKAAEYAYELFDSQVRLHRDTGLTEEQRLAFHQAEAAMGGTPLQRVAAAGIRAALRYLPRPLEHGLSLFLTADVASPTDHTLGWWLLCTREIDVHVHDGNHFNSFAEPHVRDLAQKLCARLRTARNQAGR